MEFASTLMHSAGLGLLGFIEPCTVGSTAVLSRTAAGLSRDQRLSFAATYVLVRTFLSGLLGIAAVYVGGRFLGFQKAMWIGLGALYVAIGIAYLAGYSKHLSIGFGRTPAVQTERRSAALLGALFSLNIPACAAPLLALLIGSAAVAAQSAITGFALLAVFGLAISLPIAAGLIAPPLQRSILALSRWSDRAPVITGILLALVGLWSVVLAFQARGA